jgi:uncharacterized protein YodC (DUF2158 family)
MSLSDRILTAKSQANAANRGCRTCKWFEAQSPEAQALINEWLDSGNSMLQLYHIISRPDEDDPDYVPLPISDTGFRNHVRNCRGDQ